tara:strand:+ start:312 stop:1166 length:855 start_codon:yes stop_codon:yes gene_type:complete
MKDIIKKVLYRYSSNHSNLTSESCRDRIASEIEAVLESKGSYTEYSDYELERREAEKHWVCSICGKNTFDVDYDYIGSGTNHLSCELTREQKEDTTVPTRERGPDRRKSDRRNDGHREYPYNSFVRNVDEHQKLYKELGPPTDGLESGSPEDYGEKPFIYVRDKNKIKTRRMTGEEYGYYKNRKFYSPTSGKERGKFTTQKQLYNELTADGLPPGGDVQAVRESHKLAEEIVDNTSKGYIYESPDGGETIYRRERGNDERELVEDWLAEKMRVEDNFNKRLKDK